MNSQAQSTFSTKYTDELPTVLPKGSTDLLQKKACHEAATYFAAHRLPDNLKDWEVYKKQLKVEIIQKTGALMEQDLPLNMQVTREFNVEGMTVQNILFQTQPGIYATANLFIPDGDGPFPAALIMSGHSVNGRLGAHDRGCAIARNGYVGMTIDPWGAGERTTRHGTFEYHGAGMATSLLNVGESLMGLQITDNTRAVDLLCSLPFVDSEKIGATGGSGGGNQTMWVAAMDERIKVAVPVVSVGTFESYVMGHNCVCEVLVDGLTFTEESGVLALVAPRVLLLSNGLKDANTAFYPSEMLRSFTNAMPIFELYGASDNFGHLIFDGPHSYPTETWEAMVDLFNVHLKGLPAGQAKIVGVEKTNTPQEEIMVFPVGERDSKVISTAEFCRKRGAELRETFLNLTAFDVKKKKAALKEILRIADFPYLTKTNKTATTSGWDAVTLETSDGKLIPLVHRAPTNGSSDYVIMANPDGARAFPLSFLNEKREKGTGLVIVDLSGTGEAASSLSACNDDRSKLHTVSRANLWLGKTVMGEWVKELETVKQFLLVEQKAVKISIDGTREAGLAGLFLAALDLEIDEMVLRDAPVSYLFDDQEGINFFSMGIHLPSILHWGDISLVAALANTNVTFISPVTMSGHAINCEHSDDVQKEFERIKKACGTQGETVFSSVVQAH